MSGEIFDRNNLSLAGKALILSGKDLEKDDPLSDALDILHSEKPDIFLSVADTIRRLELTLETGQLKYAFMILDLLDESGTGIEVVVWLTQNSVSIPILIYSAFLKTNDKKILKYSGGQLTIDFLERPNSSYVIVKSIQALISGHEYKIKLPKIEKELTETRDLLNIVRNQLLVSSDQLVISRQETGIARAESATARKNEKDMEVELASGKALMEQSSKDNAEEIQGYRIHTIGHTISKTISAAIVNNERLIYTGLGTILAALVLWIVSLLAVKPA